EGIRQCRTVEIMADAAHAIFEKRARDFSGNFLIDDSFLYAEGVRDFEKYRVDPTRPLMPDFFVPADNPPPPGVKIGA
ncbi:MAG TPA: short chain dehydrogenase, partial [Caulobacteraceae bacterium]|nr:short chain dehydrogenase [Caulobacteraceae bacterium]